MPLMWPLDANMPLQLVALLVGLEIDADSSVIRVWNHLPRPVLTISSAARAASASTGPGSGLLFGLFRFHVKG
jgi:hypothetical protein